MPNWKEQFEDYLDDIARVYAGVEPVKYTAQEARDSATNFISIQIIKPLINSIPDELYPPIGDGTVLTRELKSDLLTKWK